MFIYSFTHQWSNTKYQYVNNMQTNTKICNTNKKKTLKISQVRSASSYSAQSANSEAILNQLYSYNQCRVNYLRKINSSSIKITQTDICGIT